MGGFVDKAVNTVKKVTGISMPFLSPTSFNESRNLITTGVNSITGVRGARKAAERAAAEQIAKLEAGQQAGRYDLISNFDPSIKDVKGGFGQALATLRSSQGGVEAGVSPFFKTGQQAARREAALTGALGPAAQARAMQDFQQSPALAFAQEMGEKAALRGAAAQGRSLSGSVLAELNRRGTGLALQDFGNQISRLSSIANRGQSAGANLAQLRAQQATNIANLQKGQGQALGSMRQALGTNLANISTGSAAQQAQILGDLGAARANASLAGGQNLLQIGGTIAGLLCDARLKENIEYHSTVDGINMYKFNYKFAPDVESIGPIAQEHPHATREVGGYLVIDLEKL